MDFQDQIRNSSKPAIEPPPRKPRRIGCVGCALIFLGGSLLVCGGLCGGGYYTLFHSSWPLVQIEKALESTGDIQVDGLSGSVSKGFHADRVRFRSVNDEWSELKKIDFEFNGVIDVSQNNRLLVDRISVGGGEIHVRELPDLHDLQTDDGPSGSSETAPANEPAAPDSDLDSEIESLKEIRVDTLQLSDLKLVSVLTGVEFNISEILVKDFHVLNGQVISLGDIIVAADHIDFKADESGARFADQPGVNVARKLSGVIHSTIHEKILRDIPFEIDVGFMTNARFRLHAQLFGDRVIADVDENRKLDLAFQDFTLADFVRWDQGPLPGHLTGKLTATSDPSARGVQVVTIEPGASFQFGQRAFTIETAELRIARNAQATPPIIAVCSTNEPEIVCRIYGLQAEPYWTMVVESGGRKNTPELLADVLFQQSPGALDEQQQQTIKRLQEAAKTLK